MRCSFQINLNKVSRANSGLCTLLASLRNEIQVAISKYFCCDIFSFEVGIVFLSS